MEFVNKLMICRTLNQEVNVRYFVDKVESASGTLKKITVRHFDCEGRARCGMNSDVTACNCFRDIPRIEKEINEHGPS